MDQVPQTSFYTPKHWHLPIWIGGFVIAAFCGAAAYIYLFQNPSTETPTTTSAQSSGSGEDFSVQQTENGEKHYFSGSDLAVINALISSKLSSAVQFSIEPDSQWNSFYGFGVGFKDGGYYMIAQEQSDGTFKEIFKGQDIPTCELVDQYQIPHQVLETCEYQEGGINKWRANTI